MCRLWNVNPDRALSFAKLRAVPLLPSDRKRDDNRTQTDM